MSKTAQELAQKATRKLSQIMLEQDQRREAARIYVRTLFEAFPRLKLPQMLQLEETQHLLNDLDVSKNMLAEELTTLRAKAKASRSAKAIKVPPKRGSQRAANVPTSSQDSAAGEPGEALPLVGGGSGRIANGSIEDL